jgi:SAM-dependent methyltransferase
MSHETSKSLRRRLRDPIWAERIMRGDALDIGAGSDGLGRQIGIWPLLKTVTEWDKQDGDAQVMAGAPDGAFDLVHSSHCLEHVRDDVVALNRWWELVRPGGFLVVVVPDFEMYERGGFPSKFNPDHKHSYTARSVAGMLFGYPDECYSAIQYSGDVVKIERLVAHFDPSLPEDVDQSQGLCEPAIEFIVRKDS